MARILVGAICTGEEVEVIHTMQNSGVTKTAVTSSGSKEEEKSTTLDGTVEALNVPCTGVVTQGISRTLNSDAVDMVITSGFDQSFPGKPKKR